MKEIPLTLTPHELAAALAGTLRQVRRPVVPQPVVTSRGDIVFTWATFCSSGHVHTWDRNGVGGQNWDAKYRPEENQFEEALRRTPYKNACLLGQPGDVIWCKETWADVNTGDGPSICYKIDGCIRTWHDFSESFGPDYGAGPSMDYESYPGDYSMWWEDLLRGSPGHEWRRASSMPRWASRWARNVAAVRVERLQDMTPEDAEEWGVQSTCRGHLRADAWCLWDSLYQKKYPWTNNPWQWVCELGGDA